MPSRLAAHDRLVAYGILGAAGSSLVLAHWPGILNADSVTTLASVRTGQITDQLSPLLTWLWRQAYLVIHVGSGTVLALQTAGITAGLYLILRAAFERISASLLTVAMLLAPPAFGLVGLVGRDAWFVACCLLATGLGVTALRWQGRARRRANVAAIVVALLAIAARQNGFTAIAPLMAALILPMLGELKGTQFVVGRRRMVAVALGSAATALMLTAAIKAGTTVSHRSQHPEVYTYLYDLGYASLKENRRVIPALPRTIQPVQTVAEVAARWDPTSGLPLRLPDADWVDTTRWRNDPTHAVLYFRSRGRTGALGPVQAFPLFLSDRNAKRLAAAWRSTVSTYPGTYLAGRAGLWRRSIGIGAAPVRSTAWDPHLTARGYAAAPSFPVLSGAARKWAAYWAEPVTLEGSVLHRVWPYLLICLAGLTLLMPRLDAPVRMVGVLMAAVVGLQIGLFFMAPSVEFRFQLLTVYGAMIAFAVGARVAGRAWSYAREPLLT